VPVLVLPLVKNHLCCSSVSVRERVCPPAWCQLLVACGLVQVRGGSPGGVPAVHAQAGPVGHAPTGLLAAFRNQLLPTVMRSLWNLAPNEAMGRWTRSMPRGQERGLPSEHCLLSGPHPWSLCARVPVAYPWQVQGQLMEYAVELLGDVLVEGYSRVKRCTNEGRALMSLDLQASAGLGARLLSLAARARVRSAQLPSLVFAMAPVVEGVPLPWGVHPCGHLCTTWLHAIECGAEWHRVHPVLRHAMPSYTMPCLPKSCHAMPCCAVPAPILCRCSPMASSS